MWKGVIKIISLHKTLSHLRSMDSLWYKCDVTHSRSYWNEATAKCLWKRLKLDWTADSEFWTPIVFECIFASVHH